ncbi:DUF6233 domain-containing protein [Streptomyces melanogenes]|uniref:DUF6233 domain-containing protein n=1 Tax=Streptomyces melanogenes TaxID=67326 RepID=UPI0019A025B9|nr:DUF6233 domain-containing protein [Streptomyces melanogenes]GGP78324.1 hypothetical protein GCM10010278_65910 [Streptomyces melanogenes]
MPTYRNTDQGQVEAAEYRVWVEAPGHVRPLDGVSYDAVPTSRLPDGIPDTPTQRPAGWVLARLGNSRGPGRAVLHAPDCAQAPAGVPVLSLDQALAQAEKPGVRLCTLCGATHELDPVLHGFDDAFDHSGETWA